MKHYNYDMFKYGIITLFTNYSSMLKTSKQPKTTAFTEQPKNIS